MTSSSLHLPASDPLEPSIRDSVKRDSVKRDSVKRDSVKRDSVQNDFIWLILADFGGVRAALLDNDLLPRSLHYYRRRPFAHTGALYQGRVTSVDTTNDIAFVNLGGGETGVLPVRRAKHLALTKPQGRPVAISDCVREGQSLTVQVIAEDQPDDGKYLSLTARPRLMGRYSVAELGGGRLNMSKSLSPDFAREIGYLLSADDQTEEDVASAANGAGVTIIIRSGADQVPADIVAREAKMLRRKIIEKAPKPGIIFEFDPLFLALRDAPVDAHIWFDAVTKSDLAHFIKSAFPDLSQNLAEPSSDVLAEARETLEEAISEAVSGRISLPSGGWLGFYETPALTAVDVNLGGALKGRSAADAKRITNFEAALALAFHLRFQNIGGLIVIDFINMTGKGAVAEMIALLDDGLSEDTVPVSHTGLSQFGLMELSRSRTGISLTQRLNHKAAFDLRWEEVFITHLSHAEKLGKTAAPGCLILTVTESENKLLGNNPDFLIALEQRTRRQIVTKTGPAFDAHLGPKP